MNNSKSTKRDNDPIKESSSVFQQWPEVKESNNKVVTDQNVNNKTKPSVSKKPRLSDKVTIPEELDDEVLKIFCHAIVNDEEYPIKSEKEIRVKVENENLPKESNKKAQKTSETHGPKNIIDPKTNEIIGQEFSYKQITETMEHAVVMNTNVCIGCGNEKKRCHNNLFGDTLLQDVLTTYDNLEASGDQNEMDKGTIEMIFEKKYNNYLRFYCHKKFKKYDTKQNYDVPKCILDISMKTVINLVKTKQFESEVRSTRFYGVTRKQFDTMTYEKK